VKNVKNSVARKSDVLWSSCWQLNHSLLTTLQPQIHIGFITNIPRSLPTVLIDYSTGT